MNFTSLLEMGSKTYKETNHQYKKYYKRTEIKEIKGSLILAFTHRRLFKLKSNHTTLYELLTNPQL